MAIINKEVKEEMFTTAEKVRYQVQMDIPEFGEKGQIKLKQSKILVIGAGGLGCPILEYISAAGVGMLGLIDGSNVQLNDLQRQVLYTTEDVGLLKAEVATKRLKALNNNILYNCYPFNISESRTKEIVPFYDVIVVATNEHDSIREMIEECAKYKKILIAGFADRFLGKMAIMNFNENDRFDHFDIDKFSNVEKKQGVMGITCGVIGSLMASEALKAAANIGNVFSGKMVSFNILTMQNEIVSIL